MNTRPPSRLKTALIYSPVILSLLIMIPRLASPQFGLLDDGATLASAREIINGDWSPGGEEVKGRFRPGYWLFHAGIFAVAGESPSAFFAGNTLVLAASTAGLIALVLKLTSRPFQAWATGTLSVLASPVIETYYTISKAEHLQVMWIVLSLLAILPLGRGISRRRTAAYFTAAVLCLGLANISKETSLVMVPIALGWFVLGLLWRNEPGWIKALKVRGAYALACLLAAGLYFGWRSLFLSGGLTAGAGYASQYQFTVDRILESSIRWSGWLIRDDLFLAPLALAWAIAFLKVRAGRPNPLYLDLLLWTSGWILLFLPWQFMVEYYMLQAAVGFSALAALMLQDLLDLGRLRDNRWQAVIYTCLLASGLLWAATLFNNYTNGRVQLAVDAANADLLAYLDSSAPTEVELRVNLPEQNQYIREIGLLLVHLQDRPDVRVLPLGALADQPDQGPILIADPYVENKPLLSVRMGVIEEGDDGWTPDLEPILGPAGQPVHQIEEQFRLAHFDLPRLLCPALGQLDFCRTPAPLVDRRLFSYGWEVYRLP